MANAKKTNTLKLAQYGMLIAIEIVLAFTVGIITIPPISITILHIPVIIGAVVLGPKCGALMGFTFGATTMLRATMTGNPGDMLFNPAASGNPIASILMCIVPRVLLGLIAAYLYILLKKLFKTDFAAIPVTAAIATALHTVMVLSMLWFFFPGSIGQSFAVIFTTVISLNGVIEIISAIIICTAVSKPLLNYASKHNSVSAK